MPFAALAAASGPPRLDRWGRFADTPAEAGYRQAHLADDRQQATSIGLVLLAPTLLFITSDHRLFGGDDRFWEALSLRLASAAVTLAFVLALRRLPAAPRFDRLLLGWCFVQLALALGLASTRPANYTIHFLIDLLGVCLVYFALPLQLPAQTLVAALMTAGAVGVFFLLKAPIDALNATAFCSAYLLANVLGFLTARELHRWKRRQFAALQEERRLRAALEVAVAEIRTLRGILPICAHCKKIRDDAGSWQALEAYVQDRTHAQFSHGVCPDCCETHYGALLRSAAERTS